MSVSVNGTNGLTFNDATTQNTSAFYGGLAMRNRIINGAMVIDQRNAGASSTAIGYTVDRFAYYGSLVSKGTWQQNAGSVTPPAGFKNYLGFTSSSAYSVLSTDVFQIYQQVEGYNIADFGFGASGAAAITLSFWVRSSLTGTFGGSFSNSGSSRNYPFTYTISAANTWEQKTITIAGDSTGTWLSTNGAGMAVLFTLGVGSTYQGTANTWNGTSSALFPSASTSVVGTNGATFYITGVQLEKGSTATSFDYRPYGTEFMLCQRYYEQLNYDTSTTLLQGSPLGAGFQGNWYFKTEKRATPTFTILNGAWAGATGVSVSASTAKIYYSATGGSYMYIGVAASGTAGVSASSEL